MARPADTETDLVRLYLDDIGRHDLLDAEDERRLGVLVSSGRKARRRLDTGRVADARTRERLERLVEAGAAAEEEFVDANLRLVVSIAKQYRWSHIALLDLVQEGNVALIRAVRTFDATRGFRFSTYATRCIRRAIRRQIADTGHAIRIPANVAMHMAQLNRVRGELELELARAPTDEEVARALGWAPAEVVRLLTLPGDPSSIDAALSDDSGTDLEEVTPDLDSPDPAVVVSAEGVAEELARMLDALDERERAVLVLRYGLLGGQTHTWDELALLLGTNRQHVRRVEYRARARLREVRSAELEALHAS